MTKIYANLGLIGDCLAAMPFVYEQTLLDNVTVGPNLNSWVAEGINFSIAQDETLLPGACNYKLEANHSFQYCCGTNPMTHMIQGHYAVNNLPMPSIPLTFKVPLKQEKCHLQPGIAIAPFSISDHQNNKLWPYDRWLELTQQLPEPIYVLGSSKDDFSWIQDSNLIAVIDKPMSFITDLLSQSKLLVSIDTGISHLAHLLEMRNHALLYPKCLPSKFVVNPYSSYIQDWPLNVTVNQMLALCNMTIAKCS